jgi:hypothetical protein
MAQPVWITPAGSLGVIPEESFFRQSLRAEVSPSEIPANCVGTESGTNVIVCDTTAGARRGDEVRFFGETFGGIQENVTYYVFAVTSPNSFSIALTARDSSALPLISATGIMTARFYQPIYYRLQAGTLPAGMQLSATGTLSGVPQSSVTVQGVPRAVSEDVTSKFTVRAYTERTIGGVIQIDRIADRTFSITVTGDDAPTFITPAGSIGSYYDGDEVNIQIQYTDSDPDDVVVVRLIAGQLPLGLRLTPEGRIFGYIKPFPNVNEPIGYDLTPVNLYPYDFISSAISKNYQFTLEVTDGNFGDIRTFEIFVYNRADLTADDTLVTADNTFVTADQTTERQPFLVNSEPSDLGVVRGDNYFAYRFIGQDYDTELLEYAISVNQGFGLPPGLELDPYTGWYYGFIPDVEITEVTYSFFVQVRARSLVCTATQAGTNIITCDQSTRGDFYVGAQVKFEGETFGNILSNVVYFVSDIISDTEFRITVDLSQPDLVLSTATGRMLCVPSEISASRLYPFTLTVTGTLDREIVWLTDPDLGFIENGATSLLSVRAENRGGIPLSYQLASGEFNELPQGLELLPSGDISGRVTFNTFAIDLGSTTFDQTQSEILGIDPTTFDTIFRFVVNAFSEDAQQPLFKVSAVRVISGGSGYTTPPTIEFDAPVGATGVRAEATAVTSAGSIVVVVVTNSGQAYTSTPGFTISGSGSGAILQVIMQQTGVRRIVSSDQGFSVKVVRVYNKPYQDLYVVAMPPQNDRALLSDLLGDERIFDPEYIFRNTDPYFGLSTQIQYLHAVGLSPETQDLYVESLRLNHYWKNLVLGPIRTAQARNLNGDIIYEVVYSPIIDNLVNDQGDSVSKIVTTPYAFNNPEPPPDLINSVYPNSLINMRDQVIDVVGQISDKLPLWMTSKQSNGSVLGFTPSWVICYTNPGRSQQIAYYMDLYFGQRLNLIDFKVDRYVLDTAMSRNWDTVDQKWVPTPNLTTFDRVSTTGFTDVGEVNVCTDLAFVDVNGRTVSEINQLGGLDGRTWVAIPGQSPPVGTRVIIRDGSLIIFVRQEFFPRYDSIQQAFMENITKYDGSEYDAGSTTGEIGSFDYGRTVPGGTESLCLTTTAATDLISCSTTVGMTPGSRIWFSGTAFGGIDTTGTAGSIKLYYVREVASVTATGTLAATDEIVVADTSAINVNDRVWFSGSTLGGITRVSPDGQPRPYFVVSKTSTRFQISLTAGGTPLPLNNDTGTMIVNLPAFQVSLSEDLASPVPLQDASGTMFANFNNLRLAIYEITIGENDTVNLALFRETIANDYVTSTQGFKYTNGTLLYRTPVPGLGLTRNNWAPLITATQVISDETIFDQGSVQWVEPVDMYDPSDQNDKYLVFPKTNILN